MTSVIAKREPVIASASSAWQSLGGLLQLTAVGGSAFGTLHQVTGAYTAPCLRFDVENYSFCRSF